MPCTRDEASVFQHAKGKANLFNVVFFFSQASALRDDWKRNVPRGNSDASLGITLRDTLSESYRCF